MKKRILAFCLALLCVFNLIVPVEVNAAEKSKEVFEDGHPLHNAGVLWNWLSARIEGVVFSGDWYDLVGNSIDTITSFRDLLLDSWNNGDITQDSSGNLKFNTNFITGFETIFKNVMSDESNLPDVVWMPVMNYEEYKASNFGDLRNYYGVREYCSDKKLVFLYNYKGSDSPPYVSDVSDLIFWQMSQSSWDTVYRSIEYLSSDWGGDTTTNPFYGFGVADRNGLQGYHMKIYEFRDYKLYTDSYYTFRQINLYINPYCHSAYYYGASGISTLNNGILLTGGAANFSYVPIFNGLNAYKDWVTGSGDYYRVTPTYDGGDITINPNADYSKVYNNITTTIQNNYADGKDYSDILAAIQLAYAESMKEISAGLDDIGDNTEESNSWLEQIKKNTDALLDPDGSSWLARIYEQETAIKDSIDKGFADLFGILSVDDMDDPGGTGGSGSGGGSSGGDDSGGGNKTFWNKLGDFASGVVTVILDLISTVVFKALDGLDYLLGILMDNIGQVFTEMALVFGRLNNAMIVGNGFYASIYGHMPEVARDMIAYLTFCFVCAAVIRTLKG